VDTYQLLRGKARDRRDNIIKQARADYWRTIQQIEQLVRTLGEERKQASLRPPVAPCDESLAGMTAIDAADTVLREGRALTVLELAVELQQRGLTPADPRKLVRTLQAGLRYRAGRYRQDADKRWSVVS
jgi:hypothetical protein